MVVWRPSVLSRPGLQDSGEGVPASWRPGLGLFTEIRAHQPVSIHCVCSNEEKWSSTVYSGSVCR